MGDNKSAVLLCTCGKQLGLSFDFLESELKKNSLSTSVTVEDLVCQDEGLAKIGDLLTENSGHLVIAACTSQKIQPRIDQYLKEKGIDSSQIQYVNIREHSAWVHDNVDDASKKSLDMIRGTLARSATSVPLVPETKEITNHVTVVGGGIAGIESALSLSNLGYDITLIEVSDQLGGHVKHLPFVAPTGKSGKEILSGRLEAIEKDNKITILTKTQVKFATGEMGNFTIHYLKDNSDEEFTLNTSAVVMATGFKERKESRCNNTISAFSDVDGRLLSSSFRWWHCKRGCNGPMCR